MPVSRGTSLPVIQYTECKRAFLCNPRYYLKASIKWLPIILLRFATSSHMDRIICSVGHSAASSRIQLLHSSSRRVILSLSLRCLTLPCSFPENHCTTPQ